MMTILEKDPNEEYSFMCAYKNVVSWMGCLDIFVATKLAIYISARQG